jgi:hypothetical protein
MAGGDHGNIRGNKAKTKRGQKPRHQGLTMVPFVPFVGDEDGRKGVVTGEVDLKHLVWATRNFAIALVFVAQGRREEVGSIYWEVVELRVEGIGGRWHVGGESSQRVGGARTTTMGGQRCVVCTGGKRWGFKAGAAWRGSNRPSLLRGRGHSMGMAWPQGGGRVATCSGEQPMV